MDIQKLQRVIIDGLEDVKAHDIKVFNTSHLTSLFDRVIVAAGTSNRQTKALASSVREKVKAAGGHVISTEGEETGEWVLVDCGDAVVHIMQPALRQYYNLEEIWGGKPVNLKLASKSSFGGADLGGDDEDEAAAKPARKAITKKVAAKGARQVAAKTAGATAAGASSGTRSRAASGAATDAAAPAPAKRAARKTAPRAAPKTVTIKSAVPTPVVRKTAARKTVARKTAARKTSAGG
jgi:ribosome-associated protein